MLHDTSTQPLRCIAFCLADLLLLRLHSCHLQQRLGVHQQAVARQHSRGTAARQCCCCCCCLLQAILLQLLLLYHESMRLQCQKNAQRHPQTLSLKSLEQFSW